MFEIKFIKDNYELNKFIIIYSNNKKKNISSELYKQFYSIYLLGNYL